MGEEGMSVSIIYFPMYLVADSIGVLVSTSIKCYRV